jgi:hypothetical protein
MFNRRLKKKIKDLEVQTKQQVLLIEKIVSNQEKIADNMLELTKKLLK